MDFGALTVDAMISTVQVVIANKPWFAVSVFLISLDNDTPAHNVAPLDQSNLTSGDVRDYLIGTRGPVSSTVRVCRGSPECANFAKVACNGAVWKWFAPFSQG